MIEATKYRYAPCFALPVQYTSCCEAKNAVSESQRESQRESQSESQFVPFRWPRVLDETQSTHYISELVDNIKHRYLSEH